MSLELDDQIYSEILSISEVGENFMEEDDYDAAIFEFKKALSLVPSPKTDWEASTWLYSGIGDAYFFKKEYENSLNAFLDAYNCPEAIDNPFIYLRIGQNWEEMGNNDKAKDNLLRAYMLAGQDIFSDENPKFINLIKDLIS
ncbi:MAG: tetratricopeptide repeat protein [Moheibacter sp.]